MGGEKFGHPKYTTDKGGSPPRGRGKEHRPKSQFRPTGITPAWAGKRAGKISPSGKSWDHPRMGGEKSIASFS